MRSGTTTRGWEAIIDRLLQAIYGVFCYFLLLNSSVYSLRPTAYSLLTSSFILLTSSFTAASASVWYVDQDNLSGIEDGTTWTTAFTTVQAGINAASAASGGEVWVAEGRYMEAIVLSSNVSVFGGFAGVESIFDERNIRTNQTVIDASIADNGSPALHCVQMASVRNCQINGLTITGGRAVRRDQIETGIGGGIYYRYASLSTISDCVITRNHADGIGGGGIFSYNASLKLERCLLTENTTRGEGGGLLLADASAVLTNCVFWGNSADGGGGG
ncbi:MAG: right-handed parallel beta-helix repeat-containing protein, partial [Candidatus Hydrogenedentes bacterium]|nr:right-handed parallel beta-helix repeat-containing protein [Candidatus Hydrogenedentota bacterium]